MRKIALSLTAITLISGCVQPIGQSLGSSLNEAQSPTYINTQAAGTISRHCLKERRGGFGTLPPGCLVDTVFADQVAYPHDLTTPHTPGATSPRTTALAASPYLQGELGQDAIQN